MRIVDDRVDGLLAQQRISVEQRQSLLQTVRAWRRVVLDSVAGKTPTERACARTNSPEATVLLRIFATAADQFPVPAVLWSNFFRAMEQDVTRHRFVTFEEFVDYTEGAAIAPATIYLYLITSDRSDGSRVFCSPQDFALIQCGRELGLSAYIAHVLRDLAQDLATGDRGLLYLSADEMAKHGVTEQVLFSDLVSRSTSPPLRSLVRELVERARFHSQRGRSCLRVLEGNLSADRTFVLELIIRTYEAVLEKIESCSCDVMAGRHRLTDTEKAKTAFEVATRLRVSLA